MAQAPDRSSPAVGTAVFAVLVWMLVAAAGVSMALGNRTAINAVVGLSIPGLCLTYWSWALHRQDQRMAAATAGRNSPPKAR